MFKKLFLSLLTAVAWVFFFVLIYSLFIIVTDGFWSGRLAAALSVGIAGLMIWIKSRLRKKSGYSFIPLMVFMLFTAFVVYTVIPVAPDSPPRPVPGFSAQPVAFWTLKTGSIIAYYHLPASKTAKKRPFPIVFIHGGPGAYVRELDIRFFELFAQEGYEVYLYDQAGSGRSPLLSKKAYSHARNILDFEEILDKIGQRKYIVIGQSYGGAMLAHLAARPKTAAKIYKAIYAEPGAAIPNAEPVRYSRSPNALTGDVDIPFRIFMGMILNPRGGFTPQNEMVNYFLEHPALIQKLYIQSYPLKDRANIKPVETEILNFAAVSIITREVTAFNGDLEGQYRRNQVPSLLLLGESSYVERNAPCDLLRINPGFERSQYFKGVGHILWNGIGENNLRVKCAIDDFIDGHPAKLPNYPSKGDINSFLKAGY